MNFIWNWSCDLYKQLSSEASQRWCLQCMFKRVTEHWTHNTKKWQMNMLHRCLGKRMNVSSLAAETRHHHCDLESSRWTQAAECFRAHSQMWVHSWLPWGCCAAPFPRLYPSSHYTCGIDYHGHWVHLFSHCSHWAAVILKEQTSLFLHLTISRNRPSPLQMLLLKCDHVFTLLDLRLHF